MAKKLAPMHDSRILAEKRLGSAGWSTRAFSEFVLNDTAQATQIDVL